MKKTCIKTYVKELLNVIARMQGDYPKRKFTLDGRLVGDIGEILVEQIYDLELYDGQIVKHDAVSNGRKVQIKTTMKNTLTFGDTPEYYLGIKIERDGTVEEIFNGPGQVIKNMIIHRKRPKNYLFCISLSQLRSLNKNINDKDRIPKRGK